MKTLLLLLLACHAHGAQMSGQLIYGGIATASKPKLGQVTNFNLHNGTLYYATDDLLSAGESGNWNIHILNPYAPATFKSGELTFELLDYGIGRQNNEFYNAGGKGILHMDGWDDTAADFSITMTSSFNYVFAISAKPLPEPGPPMIMMSSLVALLFLRRKRISA